VIGMILIPPKRVCEEFYLTYELKGAQKGIDVLSRYYGIKRMKIVIDGRRLERLMTLYMTNVLHTSRRMG